MKGIILAIACGLLITGCAAPQSTDHKNARASNGSSYEKAIVIKAPNEKAGVAEEYRWIEKHFPGYKLVRQSLNFRNNRAYDILEFIDAKGLNHKVYFDIKSFFGKM